MRTYYDIRLGDRTVAKREMGGDELVNGGRYHIAKTHAGHFTLDSSYRIAHLPLLFRWFLTQ